MLTGCNLFLLIKLLWWWWIFHSRSNSVVWFSVKSLKASASWRPLVSHPSASWRCDWHYYLLSFESQRFPVPEPLIFICIVDRCKATRYAPRNNRVYNYKDFLGCNLVHFFLQMQHQFHTESSDLTQTSESLILQ